MWLSETKLALHIRRVKCQAQSSRFGKISKKFSSVTLAHAAIRDLFWKYGDNCECKISAQGESRSLKTWNFINAQMVVDRSKQRHSCSRRSLSLKFIELICIPAMASSSLSCRRLTKKRFSQQFSKYDRQLQTAVNCVHTPRIAT